MPRHQPRRRRVSATGAGIRSRGRPRGRRARTAAPSSPLIAPQVPAHAASRRGTARWSRRSRRRTSCPTRRARLPGRRSVGVVGDQREAARRTACRRRARRCAGPRRVCSVGTPRRRAAPSMRSSCTRVAMCISSIGRGEPGHAAGVGAAEARRQQDERRAQHLAVRFDEPPDRGVHLVVARRGRLEDQAADPVELRRDAGIRTPERFHFRSVGSSTYRYVRRANRVRFHCRCSHGMTQWSRPNARPRRRASRARPRCTRAPRARPWRR